MRMRLRMPAETLLVDSERRFSHLSNLPLHLARHQIGTTRPRRNVVPRTRGLLLVCQMSMRDQTTWTLEDLHPPPRRPRNTMMSMGMPFGPFYPGLGKDGDLLEKCASQLRIPPIVLLKLPTKRVHRAQGLWRIIILQDQPYSLYLPCPPHTTRLRHPDHNRSSPVTL